MAGLFWLCKGPPDPSAVELMGRRPEGVPLFAVGQSVEPIGTPFWSCGLEAAQAEGGAGLAEVVRQGLEECGTDSLLGDAEYCL